MNFKAFLLTILAAVTLSSGLARQVKTVKSVPASVSTARTSGLQLIDQLILQNIDKGQIAGAIGYIAIDGKVIYNKAFGYSDAATRTGLRTDNIFRIASQTKAITSVAVMMLFDEGKLLLDDPVSRYIPSFAKPVVLDKFNPADSTYTTVPAKREVTIRDLLTHTSGVDYAVIGSATMKAIYAKAGIPVGFESSGLTLSEAMDRLGKQPLVHQPGERFTYGLNTDVLGYIVEVVSGKTLDAFFSERIFKPLGMNDTYFYLPPSKYSRLVSIHTFNAEGSLVKYERNGVLIADYPKTPGHYFSGGAGLSSTVSDYAVFLQMLLNRGTYNGKRLLSARSVDLMTMNQIGELFVRTDKFGLGFQITTEAGKAKLGMSVGSFSWGGYFGTTYWVDPQKKMVCLFFTQQSPLKTDIQDKFRSLVYRVVTE